MSGLLAKLLEWLRSWKQPVNRDAEWSAAEEEYFRRQQWLEMRARPDLDLVCGSCSHGRTLHAKGKYWCLHDDCQCFEFNP